ncbi:bifunctional homocysteine S-methyltransferase/methylenetetrahydrofolate reductase [Desulfuromonas acetoxidans]|uniref:Homocysteine S-methyltransferase n=1 Tax=Desulfuromonas acetoxidans (strain DSM 684 / 11070) TaxID=281689 RepID=Q1K3H4_DESA6|nr:bifunctional homocysteine S-methyltransferase/methylenetetrahydrofolate reductase [Desulfuromonas acetoxidans]EAT17000.1 homocysteine S-methyltransferase [Desulfuromonas acetoxidans DSM 684]MBF0645715.1 bifunctional homocysteine S-methyltransferase/methylenetetrahydrofolate reductase [Desulfuromonas acetoxidans]NVD24005.1 bifunctional homocysteine S-methyltransferase/methylenetetrahydrofolate reductase [Desulfuromonas acetoxidans]NVE16302.1 bifunctional homocysteine S-methyltransferase/methy
MSTPPFMQRIQETVLIGDGAMGTQLYSRGVPADSCFERLNLTRPELVTSVHEAYVKAGAQLLETNTFTANGVRLGGVGLDGQVRQINEAGARLARKAIGSGRECFVAGSVGPLGSRDSEETHSVDDQKSLFREQMTGLVNGGVDLLLLETFASLAELQLAASVAVEFGLPVIAQMAFFAEGRTREGLDGGQFVAALKSDVDVVGANCGVGPHEMLQLVRQMVAATSGPVSAFANSGFPQYVNGRHVYLATPDYFAARGLEMVEAGAGLVGGCCGTTPEHIAALTAQIQGVKPSRVAVPHPVERRKPVAVEVGESRQTTVSPLLDPARKTVPITVELDPPRGLDCSLTIERAKLLAQNGVDAINLAENPLARIRMGNLALAAKIQDATGIPVIAHVTCRDRNLIGLHSDLMGAHLLGLRHILAVTGDPVSVGETSGATSVFDLNSVGLLDLLSHLNQGRNMLGADLGEGTGFCLGAAFNPNVTHLQGQVNKLKKKLAAGAQFFQTQPVYSSTVFQDMVQALQDVSAPVFLGLLPLVSERNAEFLHNEVPGITLPDEVRKRMRGTVGDSGVVAGMGIASELVRSCAPQADGYYIMPPFGKVDLALQLIEIIKATSA